MADGPIQVDAAASTARFAVLASPIEGRGAFAIRCFNPGDPLVQYGGERITKAEFEKRQSTLEPADWSSFQGGDGMDTKFCDGDSCEV